MAKLPSVNSTVTSMTSINQNEYDLYEYEEFPSELPGMGLAPVTAEEKAISYQKHIYESKTNSLLSRQETGTFNSYGDSLIFVKRRLIPTEKISRIALLWSFFQMVLCCTIEIILLSIHDKYLKELTSATAEHLDIQDNILPDARAILIYQGLFIASQIFQFFLFYAAIYMSSTIEVLSTTFFNGALLGYCILQFIQALNIADDQQKFQIAEDGLNWPLYHPTKNWEIALIGTMSFFFLGWLFFAIKLSKAIGWSHFKEMGADIKVRKQLKLYHIFFMFAKLCYFFYLCFDIQFLVLILLYNKGSSTVVIITHAAIAIPLTLILLVISCIAMRKERKILMLISLAGLLGGAAYLIFKLYDLHESPSSKYRGGRNSLMFFEIITLILTVSTFVVGVMCYLNFGKGLRENLEYRRERQMSIDSLSRDKF